MAQTPAASPPSHDHNTNSTRHSQSTALINSPTPTLAPRYAALAAAVSEAGGLGTITALSQPTPDALRAEIRAARALTRKPLAVNLTLLPALKPPNYGAYCDVIIEEGIKIGALNRL